MTQGGESNQPQGPAQAPESSLGSPVAPAVPSVGSSDVVTSANEAVKSPMDQFEGVFGLEAKPPVEQPTQSDLSPSVVQAPESTTPNTTSDAIPPTAEPAATGSPDLNAVLANIETSKDQDSTHVAPLVSGIDTIKDLLDKGPQVEQTPGDKLRQKISADIDAFLEEVTKEKAAA